MKSSPNTKSRSPKPNISNIVARKPKNYLNKNLSKKYIYKKEKATDTDKVLQNNKISKNIVFSPLYNKEKEAKAAKHALNNSNCDLRRCLEIRDDVNIDYDKYQQQSFYSKSPTMVNFDSNLLNQSYFLMNKKNGYITNTNRNNNKWKCPQCGNVNSNFNYLCNNCNMPNTLTLNQNNSILANQRNNSTGKNIEAIDLDSNLINNSFNSNSINTSSHNLLSKSINNNSIMKKQILKKNSTNANLTTNISSNYSSNNLLSPYYTNLGNSTIRNNKNSNYFYSGADVNINKNNCTSTNNLFEPERDSNITHLYSYSNYLANELKSSNDTNLKLLESYQNNESEYNNNYQQNDLIKKKIKILKEKENQLDKINEQLQKSFSYIKGKSGDKNIEGEDGNNAFIKTLLGQQNSNELKSKIKELHEENEKLSDKLKENKDSIIKLKTKIGELAEEKKIDKNLDDISNKKEKINKIKELNENLSKYIEEIKEQNQKYNSLDNENKILEEKIKVLKKQIETEENKNNLEENKKINNDIELEKNKYLKIKEKNNILNQFLEELNNKENNKLASNKAKNKNDFNKLKEIFLNLDKNNLIEIINDEDNQEKEMIEFIKDYMNSLN